MSFSKIFAISLVPHATVVDQPTGPVRAGQPLVLGVSVTNGEVVRELSVRDEMRVMSRNGALADLSRARTLY